MSRSVAAFAFPGGRRRVITIAATAGNVEKKLSPSSGYRWLVLFGRITLTTDGTVANRLVQCRTTDGTNSTQQFLQNATAVTASQTKYISLQQTVEHVGGAVVDLAHIALGPNLILEDEDDFTISINNGQVGDSYSGYLVVLQMNV